MRVACREDIARRLPQASHHDDDERFNMFSFGLGLTVGFVAGAFVIAAITAVLFFRFIEEEEQRDRECRS